MTASTDDLVVTFDYGMLDREGQLIYVGMSAKLCDRLLTYFTAGDDGAKEQRIAKHARQVIWETGVHEFSVQLRELELIRRWQPRFNRRGRLESDRCGYICLTTDEAPHFHVARQPPRGARRSWGPVRISRTLLAAIERLNHVFQLRDCSRDVPVRFADQRMLFEQVWQAGCLRGSLASCSAPCAAGCSRPEYYRQVEQAVAFLDGEDRQVIERIESAMREASERHDFERAIGHRDALQELTYLSDQLQLLRDVARDYLVRVSHPLRRVFQLVEPDCRWRRGSGGPGTRCQVREEGPWRTSGADLHGARQAGPDSVREIRSSPTRRVLVPATSR